MKPDALLTPLGGYDRSAIMRDAHRQRRLMMRHGWTWARCLTYSWTRARAMRARLAAWHVPRRRSKSAGDFAGTLAALLSFKVRVNSRALSPPTTALL
jgi:hypothetical protein